MYNLLVTAMETAWESDRITVERSRFLEFTEANLKGRFQSLEPDAIQTLCGLPTLFVYENIVGLPAKLGRIRDIQARESQIRVHCSYADPGVEISNQELQRLDWELDIGDELNRTHWAVKKRDLLKELTAGRVLKPGFSLQVGVDSRRVRRYTRADILRICQGLKTLSHSDIDSALLEMGLPESVARRDGSSKLDRSNALAKYLLEHPESVTADGQSVLDVLAQKAEERAVEPERGFFIAAPPVLTAPQNAETQKDVGKLGTSDSSMVSAVPATRSATARVFLVHGHDLQLLQQVELLLRRVKLEPIVLQETTGSGRTIIENFEYRSEEAHYAVVLLTDDDLGCAKKNFESASGEPPLSLLKSRPRQNAVLELGYFAGRLGRRSVAILCRENVELPSDLGGILRIDAGSDWQRRLIAELKAAGLPLDQDGYFPRA